MPAEGVWIIKTARIVPDNEAWLEDPQIKQRVARAIEWASQHAPEASDPDLNNPAFQESWFELVADEAERVCATLKKITKLTWQQVYTDKGLH